MKKFIVVIALVHFREPTFVVPRLRLGAKNSIAKLGSWSCGFLDAQRLKTGSEAHSLTKYLS